MAANFLRLILILAVVAAPGAFAAEPPAAEDLRLTLGKSVVLDFPDDIRQVSTSDPAIVDTVAVSTREILLHAKGTGVATVVVWSRAGERIIYGITVEQNLDALRRLLKETFPGDEININSSRDSIAVTGKVSSKDTAERIMALVTPFGKSAVNNLLLNSPVEKQIMLKVRFAELNRKATRQLGVNIMSTGGTNTFGTTGTGQFPIPSSSSVRGTIGSTLQGSSANFTISDALNIFAFRPDLNLGALIRALQGENLLQILAEPNLVTTNGKEASFLVGGEFPVPILQGGGNAGAVTVQFREFGIRLNFIPTLTTNGTIKLYVKPEVSTIDVNNAVSVSGFLIPALSTRRVETNLELGPGQSFVIAGLIDNRVQETLNRVPGLSSIPLLGMLFKSMERTKNESELVVIVTPEITEPLKPGEKAKEPVMPLEFLPPLKPKEEPPAKKSESSAKPPRTTGEKARAAAGRSKGIPLLWKRKG